MEQRARLNGTEIAYEISGDGPPLVWVHGLASCRDGDRDLIDALTSYFTLLSYDARGHGRSAPIDDIARANYQTLGEDLLALLERAGFERAVLAGSSMGAATCARVAAFAPARASALVLVRPAAMGDDGAAPGWMQLLFAGGAHAIRTGGIDAAVEFLKSIPAAREELERDPARERQLRADWTRHDPLSIANALQGIPASIALDGALSPDRIACPVLIVPGNDLIHPAEAAADVARRLPSATLAPSLGAVSRPDEVRALADLVRSFTASLS